MSHFTSLQLVTAPDAELERAYFWQRELAPVLDLKRGVVRAIEDLAGRHGVPKGTVLRWFYKLRDGEALLDKRKLGPEHWDTEKPVKLSAADQELVRGYFLKNQRKSAPAARAMLRDWREGKLATTAELDPATGYPCGWSERNLQRYCPTRFELKAARIGRSAAASERRLVYTTRKNLYVGQYYLFDDMWHDHFVNNLDQRKAGRPLEFHALDLASACKFAWGMRVRTENGAGTMEGLKEADMRFLLFAVLAGYGYHPQGTTLIVEHGTAAIKDWLESYLYDVSGGLIQVDRSGMEGAAAHAGQYAGRAKGNFRFKAALESLGNLIHNEMAALPGQTGMDVAHRPEGLHGLLKHNDALLAAMAQLPRERIAMLQWPMLTIQQFRVITAEIYTRINCRTQHELEGWDMNYVPDPRTGGMRRLGPVEVWKPGRRALTRLPLEVAARIIGTDKGHEITTGGGMLEVSDAEISGDELRFDASALPDREKFRVVVNPFYAEVALAFDAQGRLRAVCQRIHSVDRADYEAIQREMGAAAKAEARALAPLRATLSAEARAKAARHRHNAQVISGTTPEDKARAREEATRARTSGAADLDQLLDAEAAPVATPEPASAPSTPDAVTDSDDIIDQIF